MLNVLGYIQVKQLNTVWYTQTFEKLYGYALKRRDRIFSTYIGCGKLEQVCYQAFKLFTFWIFLIREFVLIGLKDFISEWLILFYQISQTLGQHESLQLVFPDLLCHNLFVIYLNAKLRCRIHSVCVCVTETESVYNHAQICAVLC